MKATEMNFDNTPELRLVNEPVPEDGSQAAEDGEGRDHSDLVSELIGEAGLLPPDT